MPEPPELPDDALKDRAREWRRAALQGVLHARRHAHEHEVKLRRRFAVGTTQAALLYGEPERQIRRPFWRSW
ncbi:MAG: hypothetical protein ABI040_05845 [Rhodoferax sp.]